MEYLHYSFTSKVVCSCDRHFFIWAARWLDHKCTKRYLTCKEEEFDCGQYVFKKMVDLATHTRLVKACYPII